MEFKLNFQFRKQSWLHSPIIISWPMAFNMFPYIIDFDFVCSRKVYTFNNNILDRVLKLNLCYRNLYYQYCIHVHPFCNYRSGKSSILKVVFHKMSPNETLFLESTNKIVKDDISNSSFVQFRVRFHFFTWKIFNI